MLPSDGKVVVGVSGGADSVCLLFLLCEIISGNEKYSSLKLEVVHVNHMIRESAGDDAEFVKDLCKKFEERYDLKIGYHLAEVNVEALSKKLGLSCEEAGRIVRYDAMRKVLSSDKGVIAVAHHADDRADTMLLNLFRGSGLKGLGGIRPVSGEIIRPLLGVTKNEIVEFLAEEDIPFVTDETNLTDEYTRNKIRHNIIEYANKNISSSIVKNMNSAANLLTRAEDFIEECTLKAAIRCTVIKETGKVVLNLDVLKAEHDYIIDRVLYEALGYVAGKKKDISKVHIDTIRKLFNTGGTKEIDLPYAVSVKKEYSTLHFLKKDCTDNKESIKKELNFENALSMRVLEDFSLSDIPKDAYTKWFDYDKISSVATLRTYKEGDYLTINKEMQKKSLKDYFINEKIPKDERHTILLLADGNHIMWVIGKRISEYYKVTINTKKVLEVHYVGEDKNLVD